MPDTLLRATPDNETHRAVDNIIQVHFGNTRRVTPMSRHDSFEAHKIVPLFQGDTSKGFPLVRFQPRAGMVPSSGQPGVPGSGPNRTTAVIAKTGLSLSYVSDPLRQISTMIGEQLVTSAFDQRKKDSYSKIAEAVMLALQEALALAPAHAAKDAMKSGDGPRQAIFGFSRR